MKKILLIKESITMRQVKIITENKKKLDQLAQYLYINETITGDEFMEILNQE